MTARARVPASSANLGPGYDAFGLALELHNDFEAVIAPEWGVEIGGEGAGALLRTAENEVARAMRRVFAEVDRADLAAEIVCHNGIPVGKGLGSSSAAIVGGLLLGNALVSAGMSKNHLLELAVDLEGHADNVAAALFGGFTITVAEPGGVRCTAIEPAGGLAAIVVVGEHELPTVAARGVLPASIPHADAAANAGRAALVALGISTGAEGLLELGLRDFIHERYREPLIPDLAAVRGALKLAGAGESVLSGAGPTIVALVQERDDEHALERARSLAEAARPALAAVGRGRVLALGVDRAGARLL
jgi:homoserine kinase